MRKVIAIIIMAAMLIPSCSIAAGYCPRMGDVNGDNKVNTYDAVVLLKYCAMLTDLDFIGMLRADVTLDRKVDTADATMLLKCLVTENDYLSWYEDYGTECVDCYDCMPRGTLSTMPESVWFSEFTTPYLITPDNRMARGEVYAVKFEAGKVFCVEAYNSTLTAEIWLTDENRAVVGHCRTDEGVAKIEFYCETSGEYRVIIDTYSSDRGTASLRSYAHTTPPSIIIVADK